MIARPEIFKTVFAITVNLHFPIERCHSEGPGLPGAEESVYSAHKKNRSS